MGRPPHYLNLAPNPWGAMALIRELRRLLPMAVDTSDLAGQTEAFDAAVAELVEENPELAGYIERLEADTDDEELRDEEGSPGLADLPPRSWWPRSSATCATTPAGRGTSAGGSGPGRSGSGQTYPARRACGPGGTRPGGQGQLEPLCDSSLRPCSAGYWHGQSCQ